MIDDEQDKSTDWNTVRVVAKTDDFKVLTSGFVHLEQGKKFYLEILEDKFSFEFVSDGGVASFEGKPDGDNSLKITMFNHEGKQGQLTPVPIASYGDDVLYISYSSFVMKEFEKKFHHFAYVLYIGK